MGNTASKSSGLRSMRVIARPANQINRRAYLSYNVTPGNEDLHRYTKNRFVWDEAYEMAQRHVSFDVEALASITADAMESTRCVSIQKLPDGNNNKALLLTMDNGMQAVAKIPNPNAGRPHLMIASEVATMDFVRTELELPVPKVYAWCSHAEQTPVEAEYIIMEKVKGVTLQTMLPEMDLRKRWAVAKAVAKYQLQWSQVSFQSFGSLYYRSDLPAHIADDIGLLESPDYDMERFAVGPTAGRHFNDYRRISVEFDLGPWKTASDYFKAVGNREIACIRQIDRPIRSPRSLFGPGIYEPSKERKLRAVETYLDILPHLIPEDRFLLKPCFWHPNLHAENVFVNPEDPTEITGIIDWQTTEIAPLFSQARKPPFIGHQGPQANGLEDPRFPSDYEELPELERRQAMDLYLKQALVVVYNTMINHRSSDLWRGMEFQETLEYEMILVARILLEEGDAEYLKMILDYLDSHPEVPNDARKTGDQARGRLLSLIRDRDIIMKDAKDAEVAVLVMRKIREAMGDLFPWYGRVPHEKYDETKKVLRQMKELVFDELAQTEQDRIAWQKSWPFDD